MRKCLLAGTIYTGRDKYIIYYIIEKSRGKLYEDKIQSN